MTKQSFTVEFDDEAGTWHFDGYVFHRPQDLLKKLRGKVDMQLLREGVPRVRQFRGETVEGWLRKGNSIKKYKPNGTPKIDLSDLDFSDLEEIEL